MMRAKKKYEKVENKMCQILNEDMKCFNGGLLTNFILFLETK